MIASTSTGQPEGLPALVVEGVETVTPIRTSNWNTSWRASPTMLAALAMLSAAAADEANWSYSGDTGPSHWARLSPSYAACAGANQSPIDLAEFVDAALPPIDIGYIPSGVAIANNGHTVRIENANGSEIGIDGRVYSLLQFHFHAPSENRIHGTEFPIEAHFVHLGPDGDLAVIAVMFLAGEHNAALAQVWKHLPRRAGEKHVFDPPVAPAALLPKARDYYRFNGSLTTPPCTEGVIWLVMKAPVSASAEQIAALAETLRGPNNRPVQPRNARVVLR